MILIETNIKTITYLSDDSNILVKQIKPNFKALGPKYGKQMKKLAGIISGFGQEEINSLEKSGFLSISIDGQEIQLKPEDVEIITKDIPGWSVATMDNLTVALDITLTPDLKEEGLARELVNRIQNIRKDKGFDVTDRINLQIKRENTTYSAFIKFKDYICTETLADLHWDDASVSDEYEEIDLVDGAKAKIKLNKISN